MTIIRTAAIAGLALPLMAAAQSAAVPPPFVVAQGRGEVEVSPDRAEILVQVETRAPDGARAGAENARMTRAVLDTLRRGFNLRDADLATQSYSLQPQVVYPGEGQAPRVTGYVATNSVRVRTSELARAGAIVDAALAKGATSIAGLAFFASSPDTARRRALALAVDQAKRDAEAMAVAAGGRLGAVVDISSEPEDAAPPVLYMRAAQAQQADTPIQAGMQKIVVRVTGRWRYLPSADR